MRCTPSPLKNSFLSLPVKVLVGHAAVGLPLVWDSYEPVPEWITGMGIGTTFPVG